MTPYSATIRQLTLEDAIAATQQAIQASGDAAEPEWTKTAYRVIAGLCRTYEEFTVDDIWTVLKDYDVSTPEPRALGHLMLKAARAGLCRNSGRYVKSRIPWRHGRPIPIWVPSPQ